MNLINYKNDALYVESVACSDIVKEFDSPVYVYSAEMIDQAWKAFDASLVGIKHRICYAVKANSNLAVLQRMVNLGSSFDIVSLGELQRVLKAGGKAENIVFSGVGKKAAEMKAALELGIHCFNVESEAELELLNQTALGCGKIAPISLRVNPDVDAKTHPYISTGLKENKFGIEWTKAPIVYQRASTMKGVEIKGIDCHIGSQLTDIKPYEEALDRLLWLADQLTEKGISIKHLDLGGGQGICYRDEKPIQAAEWAERILPKIKQRQLELLVEPGRAIVGNAGVLLTEVLYLKQSGEKHFAIVDAAMNDLIRPALYEAWQNIQNIKKTDLPMKNYDIVGPVCESSDFLGKERDLALEQGDHLAVMSSGAYGYGMGSNYNTRPRVAEVMVIDNQAHLVRRRETIEELFAHETLI